MVYKGERTKLSGFFFLTATLYAKRKWNNIFRYLRKNCEPRISYSEKLTFKPVKVTDELLSI